MNTSRSKLISNHANFPVRYKCIVLRSWEEKIVGINLARENSRLSWRFLPATISFLTYGNIYFLWLLNFFTYFFLKGFSFWVIQNTYTIYPRQLTLFKDDNMLCLCLTWSKTRNISTRFSLFPAVSSFKFLQHFDFLLFHTFNSHDFLFKIHKKDLRIS